MPGLAPGLNFGMARAFRRSIFEARGVIDPPPPRGWLAGASCTGWDLEAWDAAPRGAPATGLCAPRDICVHHGKHARITRSACEQSCSSGLCCWTC
eukprot:1153109-Pelagomonas_calceolata.AAC.5